jgi:YebC/PmpR family DNA-binding regulatory protein
MLVRRLVSKASEASDGRLLRAIPDPESAQFCRISGSHKFDEGEGITMSGHSKWATIKHKKGALDAKRGKIFTRLIKEITIAAKNGGGDPDSNPRLRTAIAAAKAENMPADNIKRAVQRGTGELPGSTYEEFTLEGYGPGGVALMLDINTDNRNRTVSEIRHAFGKNGGNMAEAGAVSWMFHKKGDIVVPKSATSEDDLMGIVLEAGADDLRDDGENWEVVTDPSSFEAVVEAVKKAGIHPASAEVAMIPQNYIKLEGQQATTMIRLVEALEEHDDVQNVHSNFDIDAKLLEEVAG